MKPTSPISETAMARQRGVTNSRVAAAIRATWAETGDVEHVEPNHEPVKPGRVTKTDKKPTKRGAPEKLLPRKTKKVTKPKKRAKPAASVAALEARLSSLEVEHVARRLAAVEADPEHERLVREMSVNLDADAAAEIRDDMAISAVGEHVSRPSLEKYDCSDDEHIVLMRTLAGDLPKGERERFELAYLKRLQKRSA